MMWIIRKILARVGIRREADMHCPDGRVDTVKVINESKMRLQIEAFVRLGMYYGRHVRAWVDKTEPTITNLRWPSHYSLELELVKPVLVVFLAICINILMSIDFSQPIDNQVDPNTGLPLMGMLYEEDQALPDGHYSVTRIGDYGSAVAIQHKPGPYRNFAYYLLTPAVRQLPADLEAGNRFTIFEGKVI